MGGYQTQKTSNLYPDQFNYLGVMSMGLYSMFGNYDKDEHLAQLEALPFRICSNAFLTIQEIRKI
jgi:hypothetical protein